MEFKFNPLKAIRKEISVSGHPIYIFECETCSAELRVRHLKRKTKKCKACCQRKAPFTRPFWNLKNNKKVACDLSFKQFIDFTKIKNCHYCKKSIKWKPYNSNKYFLDRKDNSKGYSVENCVVCCSRCNYGKSSEYSYEEWFGMTAYFRNNI